MGYNLTATATAEMDINLVIATGTIITDISVGCTSQNAVIPVANFYMKSLEHTPKGIVYEESHKVTAWGTLAEVVAREMAKGDNVAVVGKLHRGTHNDGTPDIHILAFAVRKIKKQQT